MRKIIRYLSFLGSIIFFTGLIICLFNLKSIYHSFILPEEEHLPPAWQEVIKRITHQNLEEKIIYKPEKTIKILEGWTLNDVGQYFVKENLGTSAEFTKLVGRPKYDYRQGKTSAWPQDFSFKYNFLSDKPKYYSLEGYLFPDTYRIYASSTPEASSTLAEALDKMLTNFDKKLTAKMRQDIAAQDRTIYQTVIMASIIEKEAPFNPVDKNNRDARIIAGIFWNRLRIGQALQSDATLSYLFDDKNQQHGGAQLEVDSPYNTYKFPGLPPTPICNPGLLALSAAIYPIDTDYNYFLTTDSRQVIFSKTYDEHLANKAKYLR